MQRSFDFPATLEQDEAGRFLVRFPDLPEALTDGATEQEALDEAADCLGEALAARIDDGEAIPEPSSRARGFYKVAPAPEIALKVALYQGMAERKKTAADLARALGIDHKEARRILDPHERTKLPRLSQALAALDYTVSLKVYDRSRNERRLSTPGTPMTGKAVRTGR